MSQSASQFDIAIIGGGMVGATLAAALHDKRLSIALIEPQQTQPVFDGKFDLRVSAITRASQRIFESLGMWGGMQTRGVSAFREMHVWEQAGRSEMHFDSAELSEPCLGHIIENRVMLASMYEVLQRQHNLELLTGSACAGLQKQHSGWCITLHNGSNINAGLLVGADGSHSWLRKQLGMAVRGWDYAQAALVTWVKTEKSHQHTAWQRFLPHGPLAFLPLRDGYSSIVWSTSPEHAQELLAMPEEAFHTALELAYDSRLGAITESGPRASFPLRFLVAESYIDEHVALVGDAAHTIHPLAGQGVNLGLADAASLAEVVIDALDQGQAINRRKVLRRYERWRRSENASMLTMVDQIQRLFTQHPPWLQWARNSGMGLVNKVAPIKHEVIQYAMGARGDLPRIARP